MRLTDRTFRRAGGTFRLADLINEARDRARARLNEAGLGAELTSDEFETVARAVANAAIKFSDLQNVRTTNYIFDLDRFVSFEGKTGPYLQYQAVRIKSLLKKAGDQGVAPGAVTISDGTNSVALDFSAGDPGNIDTLISNIRSAPGYGDLLFTVDKAANGVDIEYNWKEAGSGYELETVTVGTLASYTGLTIGDGTNSITPTVPGGGFASVDALVTAIQSATNYASLDFTVSKASNGTDIEYLWKKPGIQTGTATYTAAGITNEAIASSTLGPEKARVSYTASVSSGSAPGITASGGSDVYAVTLTGEDSLATDGVKITPEISATTPLTVRLQEDEKDNIDYFSVLQDFVNALSSNDRGQIGRAVSEITGVQEQLSVTMGDVGSSLNNVDRQSGINSDVRLQIDQLLASERDLDYAKAVTQFNQEIVRLEATQASFARIAQLSLFQYLS